MECRRNRKEARPDRKPGSPEAEASRRRGARLLEKGRCRSGCGRLLGRGFYSKVIFQNGMLVVSYG